MRRGEILGLRWSNIDFENNVLTIQQTLNWTSSGIIIQKSAKTDDSARKVVLNKNLIDDLTERRLIIQESMERLGSHYKHNDLVCCYEDGVPVKPKRITEAMIVLAKKAGVKKIRLHDLRHSHASFLLSLNINPKVAAERLGMSPQIFNNRYSHLLPTMQNEAVLIMEQSINASRNPIKPVDN
jgi:integrase